MEIRPAVEFGWGGRVRGCCLCRCGLRGCGVGKCGFYRRGAVLGDGCGDVGRGCGFDRCCGVYQAGRLFVTDTAYKRQRRDAQRQYT